MSLLDSWDQIESWLQTYAPASYASLPAPADPDAIRSAQDTTGLTFPEELVISLSRHDGSGEFILPVFHRLSSARTVADEYQRLCLVERERHQQAAGRHGATSGEAVLPPEEGHYYWNPHWIPFGYDESGNSLFISLAADETNGRVGVHEKDGGGSLNQHPVFASLEALLKAVADGLNKGTMEIWGEWQMQVDHAGYLDWRSLDGDTDTT
ncbi:SMI1/KNR4 family protein [Streptomyces sp. NPDC047315]|uniref:SMI1/KNR4 family protein n=1 Tax=Streptomyces sp. NPDC047315 TaxID=3155142 RepID=UPI0033CE03B6